MVWYLYLSETPCSHLEIVCRTTFSLIASSCCESPFDFLIAFMFSFNIEDSLLSFHCYFYCTRKGLLLQATHINIHPSARSSNGYFCFQKLYIPPISSNNAVVIFFAMTDALAQFSSKLPTPLCSAVSVTHRMERNGMLFT